MGFVKTNTATPYMGVSHPCLTCKQLSMSIDKGRDEEVEQVFTSFRRSEVSEISHSNLGLFPRNQKSGNKSKDVLGQQKSIL